MSHHRKDPARIAQSRLIEEAQRSVIRDLLAKMKTKQEEGSSLLDKAIVLIGPCLWNANSHETRILPILVAGGCFKHVRHLAFDDSRRQFDRDIPLAAVPSTGCSQIGQLDGLGNSLAIGRSARHLRAWLGQYGQGLRHRKEHFLDKVTPQFTQNVQFWCVTGLAAVAQTGENPRQKESIAG